MNALILVDIQNDFAPTGALPVPDGDQIVPTVNALQSHFDKVVATQDWHPEHHESFAVEHQKNPGEMIDLHGISQVLWPVHCVQHSSGADFISGLNMDRVERIFQKGMDTQVDSYSGFFDNDHKSSTGLGDYLKAERVTEVYVVGLATDYCVKATAMDAQQLGFQTHVIVDATRGVNLNVGDVDKALEEMQDAGIRLAQSQDFLQS